MRRRKLRWLSVGTSLVLALVAMLGGHSRRLMAAAEIVAQAEDFDPEESQPTNFGGKPTNPSFFGGQQKKSTAPLTLEAPHWCDGPFDAVVGGPQKTFLTVRSLAPFDARSLQRLSIRWQV